MRLLVPTLLLLASAFPFAFSPASACHPEDDPHEPDEPVYLPPHSGCGEPTYGACVNVAGVRECVLLP